MLKDQSSGIGKVGGGIHHTRVKSQFSNNKNHASINNSLVRDLNLSQEHQSVASNLLLNKNADFSFNDEEDGGDNVSQGSDFSDSNLLNSTNEV